MKRKLLLLVAILLVGMGACLAFGLDLTFATIRSEEVQLVYNNLNATVPGISVVCVDQYNCAIVNNLGQQYCFDGKLWYVCNGFDPINLIWPVMAGFVTAAIAAERISKLAG